MHCESSHENYVRLLGKGEADAKQVEMKDDEEEGPHFRLPILSLQDRCLSSV